MRLSSFVSNFFIVSCTQPFKSLSMFATTFAKVQSHPYLAVANGFTETHSFDFLEKIFKLDTRCRFDVQVNKMANYCRRCHIKCKNTSVHEIELSLEPRMSSIKLNNRAIFGPNLRHNAQVNTHTQTRTYNKNPSLAYTSSSERLTAVSLSPGGASEEVPEPIALDIIKTARQQRRATITKMSFTLGVSRYRSLNLHWFNKCFFPFSLDDQSQRSISSVAS